MSGEREREKAKLYGYRVTRCGEIIHAYEAEQREEHMLFHVFIELIGGPHFLLLILFLCVCVCESAKISRQIIHFWFFANAPKMIVSFFLVKLVMFVGCFV